MKLLNKVNPNTPYGSKPSNVTIIIANTKYTVNSVPITQVKAGNNILQYKAIGNFSYEERLLLNDSLKQAYIYINETHRTLQKPSTHTIERLETILGDMEDEGLQTLISTIKQIQDKVLSDKLVVLKENYLDTEKDHILASVKEDDTFTFTVYDNFFDNKEFKDNRAGVIIHELCHLCDIEEGADMYDINSAECLKNIILCLCEKLTLKQIRQEYARKQVPQERNDDTLTYRPNPNHRDNGEFDFGPDGGSGGSSNSSKKESNSNASKSSLLSDSNSLNSFNEYLFDKDIESISSETYKYLEDQLNIDSSIEKDMVNHMNFNHIESKQTFSNRMKKILSTKGLDRKDEILKTLEYLAKYHYYERTLYNPKEALDNPDFTKVIKAFSHSEGGTFSFDERSKWTQDLKKSKHLKNKRDEIISDLKNSDIFKKNEYKKIENGYYKEIPFSYHSLNSDTQEESSYNGEGFFEIIKQFSNDTLNILTHGYNGTPSSLTTGSITDAKCFITNIDEKKRTAILTFKLKDTLGTGSLTRVPVGLKFHIPDNSKLQNGKIILKNVYLNWTWREEVSY